MYLTPRDRLHRVFATRATSPPAAWRARAWLRAALLVGGDEGAVAARLAVEWAAYRAEHPEEPDITFAAPALPEPRAETAHGRC